MPVGWRGFPKSFTSCDPTIEEQPDEDAILEDLQSEDSEFMSVKVTRALNVYDGFKGSVS